MSHSVHRKSTGSRAKGGSQNFAGFKPVAARFDPASQHRRAMIAKIKIGQKELGLVDDDYRAILMQVAGVTSAKDCTENGLAAVLAHFRARGFQPQAKKPVPKAAAHPAAMKARALWISLYDLGAIANRSEAALEAFGKRQLKCEKLAWADQGQMFKLIEALKSMGSREGWDQSGKGAQNPAHKITIIKIALLRAILDKLVAADLASAEWSIAGAAIHLAGFEKARSSGPGFWSNDELAMLTRTLGGILRAGKRATL